jgi:hypothetical protein
MSVGGCATGLQVDSRHYSPALCKLVADCLQHKPSDRPDVGALLDSPFVRAAMAETGAVPAPAPAKAPAPAPAPATAPVPTAVPKGVSMLGHLGAQKKAPGGPAQPQRPAAGPAPRPVEARGVDGAGRLIRTK